MLLLLNSSGCNLFIKISSQLAFPFLIQLQALLSVQQISFLKDLEILLIFNSLLNYLHLKVFHLLLSFEEQVPR